MTPTQSPAGRFSQFWATGNHRPWVSRLTILVLAVGPAIGILGHEFVFDSLLIIRDNGTVHSLSAPWELFLQQYWPPPYLGGLYRPVSILLFSVELGWRAARKRAQRRDSTSVARTSLSAVGMNFQ